MSAPLTPSERALLVGKAQAKFSAIRVDFPPQTSAMAILDELRIAALYRSPGAACGAAMIVAPHGAGKSEAVKGLDRILRGNAAEGQIPLLHVEIDTAGTTDSVPTSILQALGAPRPEAGSEKTRWPRALAEIERMGVELIVFDEFDRAARRPTMSAPIANIIRQKIMDAGVAPVAFVGSERANNVLAQVPQLRERITDSVDLSPMRWTFKGDQELFLAFVKDLDQAMVETGLVDCEAGLCEESIAYPLWQASDGSLRRICNIVQHAMSTALREDRSFVSRQDLMEAVDGYAISNGFGSHNPFHGGNA
ncbi:TniB family NTP-binding protein [Qipengyuania atrilutea]|uniref:TniB family NTP-binding protein n=1 Tax=Qipengyuania atrilutea TaxID=2744473 RepID=A0A850H5H7_9SPHN|nr:TniB family NTP-binding protein [Actirhodobacter atriluteus]NVD45103.1 TniB family NTP-binding protein [Actirhodobacter atriluteus]